MYIPLVFLFRSIWACRKIKLFISLMLNYCWTLVFVLFLSTSLSDNFSHFLKRKNYTEQWHTSSSITSFSWMAAFSSQILEQRIRKRDFLEVYSWSIFSVWVQCLCQTNIFTPSLPMHTRLCVRTIFNPFLRSLHWRIYSLQTKHSVQKYLHFRYQRGIKDKMLN